MDDLDKSTQFTPDGSDSVKLPAAVGLEIRRLAHDLSNALEIIVQTSYLLGTVGLEAPASDWLGMMESGVEKALAINSDLRAYLKAHS